MERATDWLPMTLFCVVVVWATGHVKLAHSAADGASQDSSADVKAFPYCTGQRFLFDGIEAIWLIAENVVRFFDENGKMLKSVSVGMAEKGEAA